MTSSLHQKKSGNETLTIIKSGNHFVHPNIANITNESYGNINIVYIKVVKVGGSTVGGVMRRIGTKLHLNGTRDSQWIHTEPGLWANHGRYENISKQISKLKKQTFLITWIREPVERMLSRFYFRRVTRGHMAPTDDHIISAAKLVSNYQTAYIATPGMSVDDIIERYDFIGTTERFAESMVVLAWKLGLNLEDVLYLRAKDSHRLQTEVRRHSLNHYVPSVPFLQQSTKVQEFINNSVKKNNTKDYELWNRVNTELDLAVANIADFNETLTYYNNMLSKAAVVCDGNGEQQNQEDCYWGDNGCGLTCLNSIH